MKAGSFQTGLVFLLLGLVNGGLSEEIGWRGFALKAFQGKSYNILLSSILVAIIWALWHTATVFWKTIMTTSFSEGLIFAITYLLQYLLLMIPLSVLYTILNNGTRGSILHAVLLHAFYNISISIFATALPNFPMLLFVSVLWLLSIVLLYVYWKKGKFSSIIEPSKDIISE